MRSGINLSLPLGGRADERDEGEGGGGSVREKGAVTLTRDSDSTPFAIALTSK
jgi:hypothetical protein